MLNEQQQVVVATIEGPLLVLSGAGTGKTKTIISRIAHIITQHSVPSYRIMCVTFTNKAAKEMSTRISDMINGVKMDWMGTFHSVAGKILRMNAEKVGLIRDFTIIDADDQISLLKTIVTETLKKDQLRKIANVIQRWKDKAWTPDQVRTKHHNELQILEYYKSYQEHLQSSNSVDFADLLLYNIIIFQRHQDVLEYYQEKFQYILVDEYQDSNNVQYMWLKMLSAKHQNICCVGDDDQSIYGWRGAEIGNILQFSQDFPTAKTIRLERNYRSTSNILAAASHIISHNETRFKKSLWTENSEGSKVNVMMFFDSNDEVRYVTKMIENIVQNGGSLGDIAILLRSSFQTRVFEESLMRNGIPYRVTGGLRFYDRREIKDTIAYLRLVVNPKDDIAFERIINTPKREVGLTTLKKIYYEAINTKSSMLETMHNMLSDGMLKRQQYKLQQFYINIQNWRNMLEDHSFSAIMTTIAEESGYSNMLMEDDEIPRLENLKELFSAIENFDDITQFLEHVSLVSDIDKDDSSPMVNIMTMHASKGLEFVNVFLPGWEEGVFPHQRSIADNSLEEERRLAYVSITRARENLFISCAKNRFIHNGWNSTLPSRFLGELPQANINIAESSKKTVKHNYHRYQY